VLRVAPTTSLGRNRPQKSPTCPITISFGLSTTMTGNHRNGPTSSPSTQATATATARPAPQNHRHHPKTQQSPASFEKMVGPVVELMMSGMKAAMMENITARMEGREMIHVWVEMSRSLALRPSIHTNPIRRCASRFWNLMAGAPAGLGVEGEPPPSHSLSRVSNLPAPSPHVHAQLSSRSHRQFITGKDGANETANTGRCSSVGSTGRRQTVSRFQPFIRSPS
jgi:hypothetical protein